MKIIEKDNNANAEFGIALEGSASALTQGPGGYYIENPIRLTGFRRY